MENICVALPFESYIPRRIVRKHDRRRLHLFRQLKKYKYHVRTAFGWINNYASCDPVHKSSLQFALIFTEHK